MKKLLLLPAVLFYLQMFSPLCAQLLPCHLYLASATAPIDDAGTAELKTLNEKAYKSFISSYGSAEDVRAHMEGENTYVSFTVEGLRTRILYNKKGRELYRVKYFPAERLPWDITEFVQEEFHRYTALHGAEVTTEKGSAFMVNIRYKNSCKTVKIANNRFDVVNTFYCQE